MPNAFSTVYSKNMYCTRIKKRVENKSGFFNFLQNTTIILIEKLLKSKIILERREITRALHSILINFLIQTISIEKTVKGELHSIRSNVSMNPDFEAHSFGTKISNSGGYTQPILA